MYSVLNNSFRINGAHTNGLQYQNWFTVWAAEHKLLSSFYFNPRKYKAILLFKWYISFILCQHEIKCIEFLKMNKWQSMRNYLPLMWRRIKFFLQLKLFSDTLIYNSPSKTQRVCFDLLKAFTALRHTWLPRIGNCP